MTSNHDMYRLVIKFPIFNHLSSFSCVFHNQIFTLYIVDAKINQIKAKCNLCNSEFSVKQKEIGELKNHMETAKHIQIENLKAQNKLMES